MPQTEPPRRSSRTLLIVIIALLLLILCGGAVPVVGILAAIAIPNFIQMQLRAKRAELPANVAGIRVAELAYEATFDTFLAVRDPVPLDPLMLGDRTVDWPSGTAFDELGWAPDGNVRGTYWVEVSADGQDFTVHGLCDLDGDGEPAEFTASKSSKATMETWDSVY